MEKKGVRCRLLDMLGDSTPRSCGYLYTIQVAKILTQMAGGQGAGPGAHPFLRSY